MPPCTICNSNLSRGQFARSKNSLGGCKQCNWDRCVRACATCNKIVTRGNSLLTSRTDLMERKTVACDDCTQERIREADRKRSARLRAERIKEEALCCEKMQRAVCKVLPDGARQVDLKTLTSLCTRVTWCSRTRSHDMPLPYDERKALWLVLQNATIAPKDSPHVEAICNFLRQIPTMHSELQSFGLGDIVTYEYDVVDAFIVEIDEPFDASIVSVFEWLIQTRPYSRPNRTQCTRWLSQFSLNNYRVYTLLCLQLMCSKFLNGRSVIRSLHADIIKFVGIETHASAVQALMQEHNTKQYKFKVCTSTQAD